MLQVLGVYPGTVSRPHHWILPEGVDYIKHSDFPRHVLLAIKLLQDEEKNWGYRVVNRRHSKSWICIASLLMRYCLAKP